MKTDKKGQKKKVLFLNAYFYPENTAFCHMEQDIMMGLVNEGYEVIVVCPIPSRGISREEADEYFYRRDEDYNHIHVHRYWAPREGKNPLIRAFRYFWCNFRGNVVARRYFDGGIIFAVSTPPTQGLFAGRLSKQLHADFVYSVQDVFPDSLVTSGLTTKKSLLYRIGKFVEKRTYSYCTRIITLSETVRKNLLNKGVDENKLITIENWVDPHAVRPISRDKNRLFDDYGIDRKKFIVVYAGNFGASQGAGVILEAAALLKNNKNINFVIFGGGSKFEKAQATVAEKELHNVFIYPLLPEYLVSQAYSMGDVALITCKKDVSKTAMPSKTWSIMACNTPIIASFDTDSELADILDKSGAGICVKPESPEALANAVNEAFNNRKNDDSVDASNTARAYVDRYYSKEVCVKNYIDCFDNL